MPDSEGKSVDVAPRWLHRLVSWDCLAPALILFAGLLAYSNSFSGAFVFDDVTIEAAFQEEERLTWRQALSGPRPVVQLTFALNYLLGGLEVWGWHAVNLAIHLAGALILHGIARETLLRMQHAVQQSVGGPDERKPALQSARWAALFIALIWTVHPLQTNAVTYVIQRAEALMGLFYLATLYCAMRAMKARDEAPKRRSSAGHAVAAVILCALGMASKPVMASAPIIVLIYDRLLFSGSFGAALRRSWTMYAGLAATWLVLGALLIAYPSGPTAGFGIKAITPWQYARSQPGVILHYLRLCFWPHPLCLDYAWPVAKSLSEILPGALLVGSLLVATAWALSRGSPWAFPGAWFFLILAPTSSVMPIADLCFEHRMYLSLAGVIAATVLAVRAAYLKLRISGRGRKIAGCAILMIGAAAAAALGWKTHERNKDYRSPETIWRDVLRKRPEHSRPHVNLGKFLRMQGRTDEALQHYKKALRLAPHLADVHYNVGNILLDRRQFAEAAAEYEQALRSEPHHGRAHNNLGIALAELGRRTEAIAHFREALRINPAHRQAHNNLGNALAAEGMLDEAIHHFREALRLDPKYAAAHENLSRVLLQRARRGDDRGRSLAEALKHAQEAVRLSPGSAKSREHLAGLLLAAGRVGEAIQQYREAIRLQPDGWSACAKLARLLATHPQAAFRNGPEAVRLAQRASELTGGAPEVLDILAAAHAEAGDYEQAQQVAQRALELARQMVKAELARSLEARLDLYRAGKPARE